MHSGHTIVQRDTSQETILFGPWFPREADNAVFSYEEIENANVSFEVKVYHKNSEDTGKGAELSGSFSALSNGVFTGRFTAIKELVRFRYRVHGGDWQGIDPAPAQPCFVIYRMLAPNWYNTEKA